MTDKDKILRWQETKDPALFADLIVRYQPIINSAVSKYRTTGVSVPTLRAEATTQTIKALGNYNPNMGTQPTTHVWNHLKKVQRIASESLMSGHIPETRAMQKSTYVTVKDNMTDRLGYEPNTQEMSEELGWNKKETARMENELGGETVASKAAFDFYGNAVTKEHPDKATADYVYYELSGPEKLIFEHTFGYAGKSVLSNKQIAAKLNKNEMWVHRTKKKLADKIRSYR